MDIITLVGIASALLIIILTILFFTTSDKSKTKEPNQQRGIPVRAQEGIPRRAQIARNQRNRVRGATAAGSNNVVANAPESDDNDEESDVDKPSTDIGSEKIGAKKRAKLEAKAEKKAQREVELKIREDKKKQDAIDEEERKKLDQKEKEEERKQEEEERKAKEEKEKQEYEEYLKMKEAFSVEEEGYEENEGSEKENQLQEFVNFIKKNKVIVLEDLATEFKLKTQAVIDRITDLQKDGILTGVIDDRGKFIFISEDELNAVAKFIKQRGRVSITDLAESSNNLISLTPIVAE